MTQLEICAADVDGPTAALRGDADRLELCCALEVGGLTPSIGAVEAAMTGPCPPVLTILIRPRPGDFVYSSSEQAIMVADIARAVQLHRSLPHPPQLEFTVGALTSYGDVDAKVVESLAQAAEGHRLVFNKAFDSVPDPIEQLDVLAQLEVSAVLTSGGGGPCIDNLAKLASLVSVGGPVTVVAAGGVRPSNVMRIVEATGVARVHLRAPGTVASRSLVGAGEYDSGALTGTDGNVVKAVVDALRKMQP